jgi:hypothetical protein
MYISKYNKDKNSLIIIHTKLKSKMLNNKRKRTLLDKNTRLAPIDENKLKQRTVRSNADLENLVVLENLKKGGENGENQTAAPTYQRQPKRSFDITAIDHFK